MKKPQNKILIFVFALFIFYSPFITHNCSSQWVQIGLTPSVYSLSASGSFIYAGVYDFIDRSSDNGNSWNQVFNNLNSFYNIVAANGSFVYDGTSNPYALGLLRSTDYGLTWNPALINQVIFTVAVNGNYVFAGLSNSGVYRSTNNCSSWNPTTLNNHTIYSLAINGNYIFAGTAGTSNSYGAYLSTDNGTTWAQTSLNNQNVWAFALNSSNVFAGTDSGVFISSNNGTNWVRSSLSMHNIQSLAVTGNNVFAGAYSGGFYASTDNGITWVARNEGLNTIQVVSALCIFNNYIFAGTLGSGVLRRPLSELVGIKPISNSVPEHFSLSQNYPNPFNPSTTIEFDIPNSPLYERGVGGFYDGIKVRLSIFDITGREIATLVNENLVPGKYKVVFDASQSSGSIYRTLSSGVYFYKLVAGDFTETKKMILIK